MNAFKMRNDFIKVLQNHVIGVNKNIPREQLAEMSTTTLLRNIHPDDRVIHVKYAFDHGWINEKTKAQFDANFKRQSSVSTLKSARYV